MQVDVGSREVVEVQSPQHAYAGRDVRGDSSSGDSASVDLAFGAKHHGVYMILDKRKMNGQERPDESHGSMRSYMHR